MQDGPVAHGDGARESRGAFRPLSAMWKVPQFRRAIYDRWQALRNDATVSRTQIENKIDAFAARIADAQARDNVRWNTLGKRTWVECWNKATYQEEVDALKQWIRARITWMDQQISEYRFLNP